MLFPPMDQQAAPPSFTSEQAQWICAAENCRGNPSRFEDNNYN